MVGLVPRSIVDYIRSYTSGKVSVKSSANQVPRAGPVKIANCARGNTLFSAKRGSGRTPPN